MVCNNILEAMGGTPLVRLQRMVGAEGAEILVKMEGLNVGGSVKTRTALCMIEGAEREGKLHPDMTIWAVEPENAAILAGGAIGTHLQMGIGDGIIPEILDTHIYDDICVITDAEAIDTAKRLARDEGLMVGISSGTNVAAALKLARTLGPGKTVVTVLPDTAERYFSTPLFAE